MLYNALYDVDVSLLELKIIDSKDNTIPYFELTDAGIKSNIVTSMRINEPDDGDKFIYIIRPIILLEFVEIFLSLE